ncbi:hypothetical protein PSTG_05583 [Puccinia striiformis f. sp. tritici PST-78]|uniref:DUF6589 domain-containing protein n=1 Tax=Puccinia striiformis f. sp. tritici PST-78 TaxID=1165861 RepID=A0A0L0VPN0_9BASI|nr:hypothetical protein PSTG_05583 [Puccinia striiformis f. sp. tritici PST-78]
MPFLYNLLKSKLQRNQTAEKVNFGDSDSGDESDGPTRKSAPPIPVREATPMDPSATDDILNDDNTNNSIKKTPQAKEWEGEIYDRADRSHVISATICAMVVFGTNRRDNALQIQNAVVLLACGVTERVNMFLNYIGLSSSRRTAHRAIQALGKLAEKKILRIMLDDTAVLAPIICINNIDFEESVHDKSVEKTSQMFHGTWGYVHVVDHQLLKKFDPSDFSLEKYKESILNSATMPLKPSVFLPTQKTSYHFQAVIKSQITQVLLKYIATASDTMVELHQNPPSIDPIAVKKPNITMLKLMVASDNSAQGMGEVFEGIIRQTGLTATEFYSKLRVFEGDLGTSVYLMHYGNYSDSNDLGAWQTLSALGLSAERPTTKKDFSLMMTHLTKCHEASILYCLLTVMGYPKALLPKDRVSMPSQKLKEIVNDCYSQFFSPEAFDALDDEESDSSDKGSDAIDDSDLPGLKNLLLRLRDFASIVECDRAMQAGDIGRVINMWIRWSVMANRMSGLKNYPIHLPQMVLLLTKVLPEGLATALKHSLLVCPSGRGNHFVGKGFYLENQNYWLKYFFNHNGIGTKIDRLKEVFSLNIPILHELVQGLRADAGKNIILQSHKHDISNQSLNNFLQMAHQHDILSNLTMQKKKTTDIYDAGREALKEDFRKDSRKLNRMQPSTILLYHTPTGPLEDEAPIDESALENECEMGD